MDFIQQARRSLAAGDNAAAERFARQHTEARPLDAAAWQLLGIALSLRQAWLEAADAFRRAARIEPGQARHWLNLGTVLRSALQFDAALEAYAEAARSGADSADFLYNLGLLHLDRQEYPLALEVLRQAMSRAPQDADILCSYVQCCYDCVLNDEARAAIGGWRNLRTPGADALRRIAGLLMQLGDSHGAQEAISRALQLAPANLDVRLAAIQLHERNNRVEQAQQEFDALRPDPESAAQNRSELLMVAAQLALRRGNPAQASFALRELIGQSDAVSRHGPLFLLAKAQDAAGDYEGAMEVLQQAHAAQVAYLEKAAPRFTRPDVEPMAITRYGTRDDDVANWRHDGAPDASRSPIFIVGFPRSGTTLLEQALDAHPALRAMDEQPFLQNAIDFMCGQAVEYPDGLGNLSAEQLELARRYYWERVSTVVEVPAGARLVDKNPLNVLRLPAIHRLFPHARIILALRHPADVILSCYMQHFRAPAFARLCSSLEQLADGYAKAFAFWYAEAARLGPAVMELRYEDLVSDFEPRLRTVADFLGLSWDSAMLKPADRARARGYISTPSYAQVVEPVTRKAVDRWRRYDRHLRPLLPALAHYLQRWGYALE